MKQIDVLEIAHRLDEIRSPINHEEIVKLINTELDGRVINLDNLANEIIFIVAKIIQLTRSHDREFTIDLIQTAINELRA